MIFGILESLFFSLFFKTLTSISPQQISYAQVVGESFSRQDNSVRELESMKAGAFGSWMKLNERKDFTITKQKSEKGVGCVSAVGEMLLKSRKINVTQKQVLDIIGEPAGVARLERCLRGFDDSETDKKWQSGYRTNFDIEFLKNKENFAVFLKEFGEPAHALLVRKIADGRVIINDTYDQSYYEMTEDGFLEVWTGAYIFYGKIK